MAGKVLIAEDDPAVRELLTQLLRMEGYDVTVRSSGADVVGTAFSVRPDVVILDIMMPVTDGLTVLRALRANDVTAEIPVILLTAKADDMSTWEGWRAGCNSYIPKPFDPDVLLNTVHSALSNKARVA